jgi:hypothetical protein
METCFAIFANVLELDELNPDERV